MKKILLVFPSFYPAYKSGGPVRSATNLIKLLKGEYEFEVFTSDRDLEETVSFEGVNVDSWNNRFLGVKVFYISENRNSLYKIASVFSGKKYDLVYLNSFFNYRYSIKFIILYKLGFIKCDAFVLAPRGELTNGAMSIKSFKKKIYLKFFNLLSLKNKIKFHFTSQSEKNESLSFLGQTESVIAPNMHSEPPNYLIKEKEINSLKMIFLSRISPKKNLLLVLEALSKVDVGNVHFTIAGEVDDKAYWVKCKKVIQNLSKNIVVSFIGAINRERVSEELFKSHLFILPTLNENYGHAIVEAMMHSNLILISDQTPWSDVEHNGGSVVYKQSVDKYVKEINSAILFDSSEFNRRSKRVYAYCDEILKNNVTSIGKIFE